MLEQDIIPDLKKKMPPKYELVPGINQIYELELAIAEINALSQSELITRGAYFSSVNGKQTYHYHLCAGLPVLASGHPSMLLRAFFNTYQFKTGYATHGLFPYRGKFHPQLIKALMNIMRLRNNDVVLDPMTGSGTTNVEASIIGLKSIGVDLNPFCVFLAKTKVDALELSLEDLEQVGSREDVFDYVSNKRALQLTLNQEFRASKPVKNALKNLLLLCYLDAIAYARRRKNKTPKDVFPIVFERYMNVVKKFLIAKEKLGLKIGKAIIAEGDARDLRNLKTDSGKLSLDDESIDGIITSPPYYFAIDYLEADRSQLEYLGYDINQLREEMIGLRGNDLKEKIENYFTDMNEVFEEMNRVTKDNKYCTIIIGYNTLQIQRALVEMNIKLEQDLVKAAERHNLKLIKHIRRPIEGARNIMQTEDVLIFRKI